MADEDADICPVCGRVKRDIEPQFNLGTPLGTMCGQCADSMREAGTELGPDWLVGEGDSGSDEEEDGSA